MIKPIRSITIVGGGTAGWMAAAALSHQLPKTIEIVVVESDAIGTVGVGEATIPSIRRFNHILGIDEAAFLKATGGTFKLGIEFVDWGALGQNYFHAFGNIGGQAGLRPTHQYWLRLKALGLDVPALDELSLAATAARAGRFSHARDGRPGQGGVELAYAYHFDANFYARYLRAMAERAGVTRLEGRIESIDLDTDHGDIARLRLEDGREVGGDLFIDCSGMRALLLSGSLGEPYEDWSHYLICDRAVAMPCAGGESLYAYTRAKACAAGWQWRIPLQHRLGNGYVYSSAHISDEAAAASLMDGLEGKPLDAPRFIAFTPGKRRRTWVKNCVALGLASGFIEPLESTSIHLIQMGIRRLLSLFPARGITEPLIHAYNRQSDLELRAIRDFIMAHYKITTRKDTSFWQHVRNIAVPDSLRDRIDLFASGGLFFWDRDECFTEGSWVQVLIGQGLHIDGYDFLTEEASPEWTSGYLMALADYHREVCAKMPDHRWFVLDYCRSSTI